MSTNSRMGLATMQTMMMAALAEDFGKWSKGGRSAIKRKSSRKKGKANYRSGCKNKRNKFYLR